jgi:hypothetical protein
MPTYFDPRTERALSEAVAEALRYIEQNVPKTLVGKGRSVLTKALVDAAASGERDPCALATIALRNKKGHRSPQMAGGGPRDCGVKKPSPAWHEQARAMRAAGARLEVIATALGKATSSVQWVLDRHGDRERTRERVRQWRAATPAQHAAQAEQRLQRRIAEHASKLANLLGIDADEVMRRIGRSEWKRHG